MLARLPALGVPEPDSIADREGTSRGAAQGSLHLAGPLAREGAQPLRPHGRRLPRRRRWPRGDPSASQHRDHVGSRAPDDLEREGGCRCRIEPAVVVEEMAGEQPASRGELGHGAIGCGRLERAGPPAVDEFQGRDLAQRGDDAGPSVVELGGRASLHPPHDRRIDADGVRLAGDLRLVHHESHEPEPGAGDDGSGETGDVDGVEQRRSADADVTERGRAPGGVRVDRDAHLAARGRGGDGVQKVQLRRVVDHDRHPRRGALVCREAGERRAIGRGVAHDDVVMGLGEPQRLGQCVGQQPRVAGQRKRGVEDLPHAHRLGRDPDRHAACADEHVEGVVAQRIEFDDRARPRDVGDRIREATPVRRYVMPPGCGGLPRQQIDHVPPLGFEPRLKRF